MLSETYTSPTDNPIESAAEDRLGRAELAHDFARDVRSLDATQGAVVGVLGPWGSGKSSFINLMREDFTDDPALTVVDFNPWMFSGTEQLIDHFFVEMASRFKQLQDDRLTKAAGLLEEYGESISSVAGMFGIWGQVFAGGVGFARRGASRRLSKRGSASARHDEVARELSKLNRPVIIVIDDIDRLTTLEIRDIFKLVRLTASFPNLIYILAFDRDRVEAALDETNVPGRAYLEKIIQVAFDLPATPDTALRSEVLNELQKVMDGIEGERFDASRWSDIFAEIIYPLVGNMRDVARLAMSVRTTLQALARDVETVDLLALEAIRVFRPEIFSHLRSMRTALTQTGGTFGGSSKNAEHQAKVDRLMEIAGEDENLVKALLERVFPAAVKYFANNNYGSDWLTQWRREHRLASIEFLGMYFDRVAPSELQTFQIAEALVAVMNEPTQFSATLERISRGMLPDVLSSMESFKGDFPEVGMELAIASLLNSIPNIPENAGRMGGLLVLSPRIIVIRLVLRMLEQLDEETRRETVIRSALPDIRSYSSKLELVSSIGHRPNVGSKIVSEDFAGELEQKLVDDFMHMPRVDFASEWDLARVYSFISEQRDGIAILADERRPGATRAVLESAKGENRAQSMGSRHVTLTPVLAWEGLVKLYGNEQNLKDAVEGLREVDGDTEVVALADRYLRGWRPGRDAPWGGRSGA